MTHTYDIALSFSMEEEKLVEKVYRYLRAEGFTVFFAPSVEGQEVLSGRNQREVFYEVFGLTAEYVALFVSSSYIKRTVTMEECEIAIRKHGLDGKVIPIYLDDTELPEILFNPKETNYFKPEMKSAIEIASHLAEKMIKNTVIEKEEINDKTQLSNMNIQNNTAEKQVFISKMEGNISL